MNDWTVAVALTLGASIAVACMVYDPSDLTGEGYVAGFGGVTPDGGRGGDSPVAGGGVGAGTGGTAGATAGSGGSSGAYGGHSGEMDGGDGNGGDSGASLGGDTSGGIAGASGGVAGTSGMGPTAGVPPVMLDPRLIDDCEDHDNRIKRVQHPPGVYRNGFWYTGVVGEPYAALLPEPGTEFDMEPHVGAAPTPYQPNGYAFRLYAKQVNDAEAGNGAIGGFNFLEPKAPYDGSEYHGISFWVRSSNATPITIRFKIAIKATDSTGGVCGSKCSDHYFLETPVGSSWSKVDVSWEDVGFQQEGWGLAVPFDPNELMSVEFFVPAFETVPEVELWIDDVAFLE